MYLRAQNTHRRGARSTSGLSAFLALWAVTLGWSSQTQGDDYVLLQNGNVVQGTAVPVGPMVIIRQGSGNELKLDARQVAFSASTLGELYEFRVASRRVSDVTSCLEDARWCFRNGLLAEMAEALDAAEMLDPMHPETLRLQRQLQVATDSAHRPLAAAVPHDLPEPAVEPAAPAPSRAQPLQTHDDALDRLNVSHESLAFFTSRVQPILINRCGNSGCHRSPTTAGWELTHMGVQVRPPARMTRLNLVATLKLIHHAEQEQSDLLRYAAHPHGGRDVPPLRRVDEVAWNSLREWTQLVADSESNDFAGALVALPEASMDAATEFPAVPLAPQPNTAAGAAIQQVGFVQQQATPAVSSAPAPVAASPRTAARPARLPPIGDPFNPDIFNRHYRGDGVMSSADR